MIKKIVKQSEVNALFIHCYDRLKRIDCSVKSYYPIIVRSLSCPIMGLMIQRFVSYGKRCYCTFHSVSLVSSNLSVYLLIRYIVSLLHFSCPIIMSA